MITQTVELALDLRTKNRLLNAVADYALAKRAFDEAEHALEVTKGDVQKLMPEGVQHLDLDGIPLTWVQGTQKRLDEKALLRQGVTMAQIEAATIETPKRPYLKITLPRGK
jgi:DNA polymerase III psi subunit